MSDYTNDDLYDLVTSLLAQAAKQQSRIEELETALRGVIVLVDTTPPAYPTAIFYLASDALAKGTDDVK